jgi:hypothetical protein
MILSKGQYVFRLNASSRDVAYRLGFDYAGGTSWLIEDAKDMTRFSSDGKNGLRIEIYTVPGASVDRCMIRPMLEAGEEPHAWVSPVNKIIHKIADAFNYDWFSLSNTYDRRENAISASMPCTLTISYRPIVKDTI